jgi:hypothetical protein
MTGAMIVLGGLLNSGLQLVIGYTNRLLGPAWGYRSSLFYVLILLGMLILLARRLKKKGVYTEV